jgi:hypothetical protein
MVALLLLLLNLLGLAFKLKSQLAVENAALQQQLVVLRRKLRGRVEFTDSDRLFFIQLYRLVSVGSERHHDRSAGDVGALVSCGLSPVLALEVPQSRRPVRGSMRLYGP